MQILPIYGFLVLILCSSATLAEEKKPKFTEDQLNRLKEAEIEYKDNPDAMRVLNQLKDAAGITDEQPVEVAPVVIQAPKIQGSRSTADSAYAKGDYETAIKHYEALAEAGDSDASLVLGTMYEQGKGTEKDKASAHAWYKKAAEGDDVRGEELMGLIENTSSKEELAEADKRFDEINNPQKDNKDSMQMIQNKNITADVTGNSQGNSYRPIGSEVGTVTSLKKGPQKTAFISEKLQPYSPIKLDDIEYLKPVSKNDYVMPEKFYREAASQ